MIKIYRSMFLLICMLSLVLCFSAYADIDRKISKIYIQNNNQDFLEVSSISFEYFSEIYFQIQTHESIPFGYPDDGCFARAHKTSLILDSMGIVSVKSFLVGDLKLQTADHPQGFVQWWYHVAAAVHVKGLNQLFVFDPTASEIPISKSAWMELLTQHKYGHIDESFETVRYIYSPEDAYQKRKVNDYIRKDIFDMEQSLNYFFELLEQRTIKAQELYVS